MKAEIIRVRVQSWYNKKTGKRYEIIHVRYPNREYTYNQNDTLPMTVVTYILNAPCKTTYIPDDETACGIKIERYAM